MTAKNQTAANSQPENECNACANFHFHYRHDAFDLGNERPELAGTVFFTGVPTPFGDADTQGGFHNACLIPGKPHCPNFKTLSDS